MSTLQFDGIKDYVEVADDAGRDLADLNRRARELLESTDESIESIAGMAGFGSTASLRQHFTDAFRTSPSAWRREFRGV